MLIVCLSMGILLRIDIENKSSPRKKNRITERVW